MGLQTKRNAEIASMSTKFLFGLNLPLYPILFRVCGMPIEQLIYKMGPSIGIIIPH